MKILFKIILCSGILITTLIHSQDTNIIKFFPLNIGNVWVYNVHASVYPQCYRDFYYLAYIDSIKEINSKTYYKINTSIRNVSGTGGCGYIYLSGGYYRLDSLNGNIYKQRNDSVCTYHTNEVLFDSLASKMRDTAYMCSNGSSFMKILKDTFYTSVFNNQKQTKNFEGGNFFEYGYTGRYARDFGLIEFREFGMSVSTYAFLKGCIVNGIMYGDTNYYLVGINPISGEIPHNFSLSQNYPNPFNPSTIIKFAISGVSVAQTFLSVYDILGNEIAVLVNQNLLPSEYNTEWNASSFPSGVYYYKLQAGEYSETKKMVLIK